MTWNIVCDSSGDMLPAELVPGKVFLKVAPLTLRVGDKEYVDDESLKVPEFLAAMTAEKGPSGTACPSPETFVQAFSSADCSLCFAISGNLSGCYNAACLARDIVLEDHPEKKIYVLDTCSTSGSLYLLTELAVELIESGMDFEEICKRLDQERDDQRTVFTLQCFDNLVKNGRMKPLLGTILEGLGIHVIADATPVGTIRVVDKARGEKRAYRHMVEYMAKEKDCTDRHVIIAHCQNPEGAAKLKEAILAALPVKKVTFLECRGLTTFYAMEKGLIVVY
ncbi:MAG: DegV family protein [Ruminiclostridium sp.]|nr:DegV family protein [Ruminiclostridium sp.]